jgi:benzodiazapine receptor
MRPNFNKRIQKMKIKANYIIIPLVTIAVAAVGSWFTQIGMPWYQTELIQPELTPPSIVFPIAWNTIFILTTASALIMWNKFHHKKAMWIFGSNAILNVLWSLLFFTLQLITIAFIEMFLLEATLLALLYITWKKSRLAFTLLLPYAIWVCFATYLTYIIVLTN